MELINESPLPIAWIVGKTDPPNWSMTCIVKGTFVLRDESTAELAKEQLDLTGDENASDDSESVLVYPDDFSWRKPRTDLLLIGTCHAPGSRPTSRVFATFQVGPYKRTLLVSGNRKWSILGATEPEPFEAMPLTYERAFGGPASKRNPLGRGFVDQAEFDESKTYDMPNIEDPDYPVLHPTAAVEPAGFAPIPPTWPSRMTKMGTFDDEWLNSRWPWYPKDFDYGFFNSAPDEQQAPYLRGDEEIHAENLHPSSASFSCRLPGIRPRCFLRELVAGRFETCEVPLALDTVWVNMETMQLVLTWRGIRPVRSDKLLEVSHLFLAADFLSEAARPAEEYADLLALALIRRANQEAEDFDIEQPDDSEEDEPEEDEEDQNKEEQEPEEDEEEIQPEKLGKAVEPIAVLAAGEKAAVSAGPFASSSESQIPLVNAPQPAPPTGAELTQELIATLQQASQSLQEMGKKLPDSLVAALSKPPQIPDEPTEDDEAQEVDLDTGEVPGAEFDELTLEQIREKIARRQNLSEHDLTGMDLAGLDLSGLDLHQSILQDARLSRCILNGADFSGAFLASADLRQAQAKGAIFVDADLTFACLAEADLSGVDLTGADLSEADLRLTNLEGARAEGVVLSEADLSYANLRGAQLSGSDLSGCRLHGADLQGAKLSGVVLEQAWGRCLRADGAILAKTGASETIFPGASFQRLDAVDSAWEEAQLYAADFAGAQLDTAEFTGAYLDRANFNSAQLRRAVFDDSSMREVSAIRANFLEAFLINTDLANGDLRESNLYGAKLRDTSLAKTNLAGANLRMTIRTTDAK